MFEAITEGIRVEVSPRFDESQSDPGRARFLFSYHVRITNQSAKTVRLLRRHWFITDAFGSTEEVEGPGVIGRQPRLTPGASFEYQSFCPLATPRGEMKGTYAMETDGGETLQVEIPRFTLTEPGLVH